MLTGSEIKKRLGTDIIIEPFNEAQLNPNSYNVRLHPELLVYDMPYMETTNENGHIIKVKMPIDPKIDNPTTKITIPESGLVLEPGRLYLGRTVEYIELNNIASTVAGRSSIGRLGITIHITAAHLDIGFKGTVTFEIFCVEPVIIYPNLEIGQLVYYEPVGDTDIQYNGRYQGQIDATPTRLFIDYKEE